MTVRREDRHTPVTEYAVVGEGCGGVKCHQSTFYSIMRAMFRNRKCLYIGCTANFGTGYTRSTTQIANKAEAEEAKMQQGVPIDEKRKAKETPTLCSSKDT